MGDIDRHELSTILYFDNDISQVYVDLICDALQLD